MVGRSVRFFFVNIVGVGEFVVGIFVVGSFVVDKLVVVELVADRLVAGESVVANLMICTFVVGRIVAGRFVDGKSVVIFPPWENFPVGRRWETLTPAPTPTHITTVTSENFHVSQFSQHSQFSCLISIHILTNKN